ncbi:MAG: PAS domain-containing protein, partial [Ignavibacterium sp.]
MNNLNFDFTLFDNFPDMFFLVDRNGKITRMNKVASNTLNQSVEDTEIFFDYVELCDRNNSERTFS